MMKQGHLVLTLVIIAVFCFLSLEWEQRKYDRVMEKKQNMEQALLMAMEAAGNAYQTVLTETEEERIAVFEKAFFEAFYVAAGVYGDKEQQEILTMHLPLLILAEEDGAFFYFTQERNAGTVMELQRGWSEKIPFLYEETDSQEERKNKVAEVLEYKASEIISRHNYIADQYGESYSFYVPDFLQNTSVSLHFPMMFVVFQGWPLLASGKVRYDNCLDAGIYLQMVERYTVTGREGLTSLGCRYHKELCPVLESQSRVILKENVTKEEAIREFGAWACDVCLSE